MVFLLGIDGLPAARVQGGQADDELALQREADARKLYMAMTRASRRLVVLTTASVPAAVAKLLTAVG